MNKIQILNLNGHSGFIFSIDYDYKIGLFNGTI